MDTTTETRVCSQCGEPKPLVRFRPTGKRWRVNRCRDCERGGRLCACGNKIMNTGTKCTSCRRKARIERDGVTASATVRAWLNRNLSRLGKFRKRHIDVAVTLDDLLALWDRQGGKCAVSGLAMSTRPGDLCNASVDRIAAAGHYTPDNVMLTCKWVNIGRGQSSVGEFVEVLARLGQVNPGAVGATGVVGRGDRPAGRENGGDEDGRQQQDR